MSPCHLTSNHINLDFTLAMIYHVPIRMHKRIIWKISLQRKDVKQMDATLSSYMTANLQSLQQTLSMSVSKMAMNTQTAVASEMISDFTEAAPAVSVPVGDLGHSLDVFA